MEITFEYLNNDKSKTEDTYSALWVRFLLPFTVSKRTRTYLNSTEAKISPLGSKIFGFPWVDEIQIEPQSMLIKRQEWVDFDIICEPLKELISEHFENFVGAVEENPEPIEFHNNNEENQNKSYSEYETKIIKFLDEAINPQVAEHGGKISLVKLEDSILFLKMEGGCQGCNMAQETLRSGVETALKKEFDFITKVIDTTDHASGVRPYF